jgi:hypothetical protein
MKPGMAMESNCGHILTVSSCRTTEVRRGLAFEVVVHRVVLCRTVEARHFNKEQQRKLQTDKDYLRGEEEFPPGTQ